MTDTPAPAPAPFNTDRCSAARDTISEILRELCEATEHGDGDGNSWFVLGFHTPDMEESGIYATSSLKPHESIIAARALYHTFAAVLEGARMEIEAQGLRGKHSAMLHAIGSSRHELDPESAPIDVLMRYEAAVMANEGAEGPLPDEDRLPIESALDELIAQAETDTGQFIVDDYDGGIA